MREGKGAALPGVRDQAFNADAPARVLNLAGPGCGTPVVSLGTR